MSTITPGNASINGISLAMQAYIEQRAQTAALQAWLATSQEGQVNLTQLREDAAFDVGVPAADIVP